MEDPPVWVRVLLLWILIGFVTVHFGWVSQGNDTWQYGVAFSYWVMSAIGIAIALLFLVALLIGALWRTVRWAAR